MRSFVAVIAAIWFLFQALTFVPPGARQESWPFGEISGDPAAVAIAAAARVICFGLSLASIAIVSWDELSERF
jgi:hypothetical protein